MKNLDIYLRNRITECDILISSLALHEDMSADARLTIESCLEKCLFYKMVSTQSNSELVSHIDHIIKTCHEKLRLKANITVSAEFAENVWSGTAGSSMVLGTKKFKLKARTYEQFANQVEIADDRMLSLATKRIASDAGMAIEAEVDGSIKTGYISPEAGLAVNAAADATGTLTTRVIPDESVMALDVTASFTLRRSRSLSEIDAYDPITNGPNTLSSLDFVVLEE